MVQEKYGVRLTGQERGRLRRMIRAGTSSAQAITRARILLKTDEGWTASRVAEALDVSERTVRRAKRRYVEEGMEEVLRHHNSPNPYRKVDDKVEAHLIALACSPAPDGQDHWTLRALAGKAVELGLVESLSHETVRLHLKKHPQAVAEAAVVHPQGRRRVRSGHGGCPGSIRRALRCPEAGGLLRRDLHPTAGRNQGSPAGKARTPRREDYEYVRAGTRNLFLTCEPKAALRQAQEAPCGDHPAAHHAGLRPSDALAGGRGLPGCPGDSPGFGQGVLKKSSPGANLPPGWRTGALNDLTTLPQTILQGYVVIQ